MVRNNREIAHRTDDLPIVYVLPLRDVIALLGGTVSAVVSGRKDVAAFIAVYRPVLSP